MNKDQLIDSLYKIMCTATSTASDAKVTNNDYFKRRVLGFRAEIEFEKYALEAVEDAQFLEGGQFISKKLAGERDDKNVFLYTTVSEYDPQDYKAVYSTVGSWSEVEELFFIQSKASGWGTEDFEARDADKKPINVEVLTPSYSFYRFDRDSGSFVEISDGFDAILKYFERPIKAPNRFKLRKRGQFDYFGDYDISILRKIYANRYFIDVIMRQARNKQIIDLDGFIVTPHGLTLIEIKEKSPIKGKDLSDEMLWQYGWDSRRILWYLYLLKHTSLSVLYCVRQIDDRHQRNFMQWDTVTLDEFLTGTSWSSSRGGGGGEDTLTAPYSFFSSLDEHF